MMNLEYNILNNEKEKKRLDVIKRVDINCSRLETLRMVTA